MVAASFRVTIAANGSYVSPHDNSYIGICSLFVWRGVGTYRTLAYCELGLACCYARCFVL
jgi:hypothetical protein